MTEPVMNIRIPDSLWTRLKAAAAKDGRSGANLVKKILKDWLDANE